LINYENTSSSILIFVTVTLLPHLRTSYLNDISYIYIIVDLLYLHGLSIYNNFTSTYFLNVLNLIIAIFSNIPMTARPAITMVTVSLATLQIIEFFNLDNNHCKDYKNVYRVSRLGCKVTLKIFRILHSVYHAKS
jgi:hypothetical protein